MSIRLLSWVWENSTEKQEALLVHLALADFANDNGICFPSIETLAAKARITIRSTQRILRTLETRGHVETERNKGPGGVNLYHMATGDIKTPRQNATPDIKTPRHQRHQGGDTSDTRGVTPATPRSVNRSVKDPSISILGPFQELRGFSVADQKQLETLVRKIKAKYADIDLEEEALKMAAWLDSSKGKNRQCSPGFILKWLSSPYGERSRSEKSKAYGGPPGSGRDVEKFHNWPNGQVR